MSADASDDEEAPIAVPLARQQSEEKVDALQEPTYLEAASTASPIPVLLVTGFLGAGKTTLLNHILTEKHGFRCAVILNEFGESAGIEKALLNDSKGKEAFELQDWVQLSNGCACCSVKNDFVKALEGLLASNGTYDYILIETTGLASPGPIAAALWTDAELESAVCLDAIVTVVDASNILRQLAEDRAAGAVNEAQEQVAYADVILCNKVDRVGKGEALDHVTTELRRINEDATILHTSQCRIDVGQILDRGTFSPETASIERKMPRANIAQSQIKTVSPAHGTADSRSGSGHDHWHDTRIRTVRLAVPGCMDLERLKRWLDNILWEKAGGANVMRLKGLINLPGGTERKVIQAVQEVYDIHNARLRMPQEAELNEIVLIGKNLDLSALRTSLLQCLV